MRYYLTSVKMAIIKKKRTQIINVHKDMEKREPSYTVGGNAQNYSYCEL